VIKLVGVGSSLTAKGVIRQKFSVGLGTLLFPVHQKIGTSKDLSFSLVNAGANPIQISKTEFVGADFAEIGNECIGSLPPASSCKITVRFTALAWGPRWGQINISDDDPGSVHMVRLAGYGVTTADQMKPGWDTPMVREEPTHRDFDDDDDD